jgi:hypothetical protein
VQVECAWEWVSGCAVCVISNWKAERSLDDGVQGEADSNARKQERIKDAWSPQVG